MDFLPGKYYVHKVGELPFASCLAGPFDSDHEAFTAAGAIEASHSTHRTRTEVWQCPLDHEAIATPACPTLELSCSHALLETA